MDNTYWSHNGRFQKEYEELWERLVPGQGPATTKAGEALRALSKLYYRWFNDGDRIENSMTEWDAEGGAARYLLILGFCLGDFGIVYPRLFPARNATWLSQYRLAIGPLYLWF